MLARKAQNVGYLALIGATAASGSFNEALELIGELESTRPTADCIIGIAVDQRRLILVARGPDGRTHGHQGVLPSSADYRNVVPPGIRDAVAECPTVRVVAAPPIYGAEGILPDHVAWAYSRGEGRPPLGRQRSRLVISDVDPPARLGLPRLPSWNAQGASPPAEDAVTATTMHLRGAEATPARVLAEAPSADEIELHVHGIMDRRLSDAAALVLSPGTDGEAYLTLEAIEQLRLSRRPIVVLGACHAARAPQYESLSWNLPSGFLKAGASLVLASPGTIEDAQAAGFFAAVLARIRRGDPPAIALRDARMQGSNDANRAWTREVVLYH